MRCGSAREGMPAGCRCGSTTVFEGATVGQVFTGHVEMTCPIVAERQQQAKDDDRRRSGSAPLATALLTIAIWQAWLAVPISWPEPAAHLLHSLAFVLVAFTTRSDWIRLIIQKTIKLAAPSQNRGQ
jgi:hypothetical protein